MPSNHFILCRLLLLLPSIFPSIRVFSKRVALYIRWPKYWSFSRGPFNGHFLVIILTWAFSTIWYNRSLPTLGTISSLDLQNSTSFWFPFKFLFSSFLNSFAESVFFSLSSPTLINAKSVQGSSSVYYVHSLGDSENDVALNAVHTLVTLKLSILPRPPSWHPAAYTQSNANIQLPLQCFRLETNQNSIFSSKTCFPHSFLTQLRATLFFQLLGPKIFRVVPDSCLSFTSTSSL